MTATTEAPAAAEAPPVTEGAAGAALAVRQPRNLAATIPAKLRYAQALADSGLLPVQYRGKPGNVLWAVEYGEMLGIGAMAAITGVHVIEGKPTASAGLISGLVRRAGHKIRVWGNNNSATCEIIRADDPDFTYRVTWTLKKNSDGNPSAEEAGLLGKDVWKKYGASMLKSRAISQNARDAAEDVLFGVHYTPEELGAEVDEEGNLLLESVADGGVTDRAWFNASMLAAAALETLDACRDLWRESTDMVGQGLCTRADAEVLQGVLRKRMDMLRASEAAAAAPEPAPQDEPRCPEGLVIDDVLYQCTQPPGHWREPGNLHRDESGKEWSAPGDEAAEPAAAPADVLDPEDPWIKAAFGAKTHEDVNRLRGELATSPTIKQGSARHTALLALLDARAQNITDQAKAAA